MKRDEFIHYAERLLKDIDCTLIFSGKSILSFDKDKGLSIADFPYMIKTRPLSDLSDDVIDRIRVELEGKFGSDVLYKNSCVLF